MGFKLARNGTSDISRGRTPEKEAADRLNHNHMMALRYYPPITIGSEKQVAWAKSIAEAFLFHAHAWSFTPAEIDSLFANRGKYAKFWIDNRNPSGNSGEGVTRVAVEKELAEMAGMAKAERAANHAIAQMTTAQLATKLRRF